MAIISAHNIHRTFGKPPVLTHVLKGVDFEVKEKEFVAIMGKSGAGKSTLLYQLSALDEPSKGSVLIDGVDVCELNEKDKTAFRLRTLGYVFQDYALVPDLNARENIMMPMLMKGLDWVAARARADEALDSVSMPGKYENLPSELSGGEQQRVAVARAIAGNPKILFADEPTANLDSVSGTQIIDLLGALHKSGQTIVMVTHEKEYTKYCNRIVEMEDGKILKETRASAARKRIRRKK